MTHIQYLTWNMTVAAGSVESGISDSFTLHFYFCNAITARLERIFHFSGTEQLNLTCVV